MLGRTGTAVGDNISDCVVCKPVVHSKFGVFYNIGYMFCSLDDWNFNLQIKLLVYLLHIPEEEREDNLYPVSAASVQSPR